VDELEKPKGLAERKGKKGWDGKMLGEIMVVLWGLSVGY
jgi:hypothetical protein